MTVDRTEEDFIERIKSNPFDGSLLGAYADFLQKEKDQTAKVESFRKVERLRAARDSMQAMGPIEYEKDEHGKNVPRLSDEQKKIFYANLGPIREAFNVVGPGVKDDDLAAYFIEIGTITDNKLMRLQGEYLQHYLQNHESNEILLRQIRKETQRVIGLTTYPEYNVTAKSGRVFFDFTGDQKIKAIPDGFQVGGGANFGACPKLSSVGAGFYAGGDANFSRCHKLLSVRAGFYAGADAIFDECTKLSFVDDYFHAGKDAVFLDCSKLDSVGAGFHVKKRLNLTNSGMQQFPADITIGGEIIGIPQRLCFTDGALRTAYRYKGLSHAAKECIRKEMTYRGLEISP